MSIVKIRFDLNYTSKKYFDSQVFALKKLSEEKSAKIDVDQIKNYNRTVDSILIEYLNCSYDELIRMELDHEKIFPAAYLKELPSERYNGIINANYMILNPNATTSEIDMTLVW